MNNSSSQTVLVSGATGYIGGRLIPELLSKGLSVRILVRNRDKLLRREWINEVEIVEGDALDASSLRAACQGIDVAYYLIHSMTSFGHDFAKKDAECAANFSAAAAEAGVKQIIYLGGLGATGSTLSKHLSSRHQTGALLSQDGVAVTELRAAIVIGSGSASFEIVRDLVKKLPIMICPRWVQSKCEPIAISELLQYLVGVLGDERTYRKIFHVGCGEALSYGDLMKECASVMGKRLWIFPVPLLTPRLSSYWLNLVTSVPINLARPLVEGLRNDCICTDRSIEEIVKTQRVSCRGALEQALLDERKDNLVSRWTDATTSNANFPVEVNSFHYVDKRKILISATPEKVYQVIERVGGENGWFHADWLWYSRAIIDSIFGGVGMRRGRPSSRRLHPGDPVDFFRVENLIRDKSLTLRGEMILPGVAQLHFELEPETKESCSLVLEARFWPSGFWGKAYWYGVLPLHNYVFNGMLKEIKSAAER